MVPSHDDLEFHKYEASKSFCTGKRVDDNLAAGRIFLGWNHGAQA